MKFLLLISLLVLTGFVHSQTSKIVARKDCNVSGPCPANSTGTDLKWSGIKIYDWWDHDTNPSTLDTLSWGKCYKKTTQNSGALSVVNQDNCSCRTNFTKTPSSCIGESSCACVCNRSCSGNWRLNSSTCSCFCPSTTSCPSGYALDTSSCSCACNRTCGSGFTLNTSTCSCSCNQTCSPGETLNTSTCSCEVDISECIPRSCTPANKTCPTGTTGTWNAVSNSGRRECVDGSLSSVCTGGSWTYNCVGGCSPQNCTPANKTCPTGTTGTWNAVSNSGRRECVDGSLSSVCTGGSWTYNCVGTCTPQSCTATRACQVGTGTERGTGTKNCRNGILGSCEITSWDISGCSTCNSQNCSGSCKECRNGQCVNKANTSWSPPLLDPDDRAVCGQSRESTRCNNGSLENRPSSGPPCAPPPQCTSDADCGTCRKCNKDGQCENANTSWPAWTPGWTPSLYCPTQTKRQTRTRCLNGSTSTGSRTLRGTKNCCTSNSCGTCKRCNGNSGQCVNANTSWTAWTPAWNRSQHCTDESQVQTRTRCLSGSTSTGSRTLRGTVSNQRCTPGNKTCPAGHTGTWNAVRNSGTKTCRNGRLGPCTGGSWNEQCRRNCSPETCRPTNKTCSDGTTIQSAFGRGQYQCKNGRVDKSRCVYSGSWIPAQCPPCTCPIGWNLNSGMCYDPTNETIEGRPCR